MTAHMHADEDAGQQWHRIRLRLREELGEATFDSWLRPLDVISVQDGIATLSVPTKFMREWVERHYSDRLRRFWNEENAAVRQVEILLNGRAMPPAARDRAPQPDMRPKWTGTGIDTIPTKSAPAVHTANPAVRPVQTSASQESGEHYLGAPLDEANIFEHFVVGKSNELAHAAARRVAESEGVPFNPLFLHGATGLGKTHLMHAIAWEVRRRFPHKKVIYLSAEKFMYQFIAAVRYKNTLAFKNQFRNVDVLMIDDFQYISGKDSTQEEFFHTFNALVDHNRQVIISADRSPSDLENIEERIRSRLGWGLVADIHPTDYELRLGILQAKAHLAGETYGQVDIPQAVLEFLAHKITANVRELEGALHRVLAHASLVGRPVTIDVAQEVLRPLIKAHERRVTVDEIQRRVAEYYQIKLQDLLSKRRARPVARPRQIAMYLAKQLTTRSLPDIGRRFGGRDHTTVMHAVRRIDELRKTDPAIDEEVEVLRRMLEG